MKPINIYRRLHDRIRGLLSNDPGLHYRRNFNPRLGASQGGEDGVLREIFRRLNVDHGWFVEFGAWDGIRYSNTYALVQRGWSGVFIEADPEKHAELVVNMRPFRDRIIAIQRFVSADGADALDSILVETPIPADFDLLSIDIDGNDYWVWRSVARYRPKVVVIEYNPNFGPDESKTIRYDPRHCWDETMYYGASARALWELGREKRYTLIGHTPTLNLFFVRDDCAAGRFEPLPLESVTQRPLHIQRRCEEFIDVGPTR